MIECTHIVSDIHETLRAKFNPHVANQFITQTHHILLTYNSLLTKTFLR